MTNYEYNSDLERQETQEYEDVYSAEEIELNKKLYEECFKKVIDFEAIEKLLKQGADPMGPTVECGWGILEHIYEEIVSEANFEDETHRLPQLTELFLRYGMDIDNPRIPYDGGNSINPLWSLGLHPDENSIETLKLFLDHGISVESFGEFWSTAMGDLIDVDCGDPVNDTFWNSACTRALQATMLAASYDYMLNQSEHLKTFVGISYNDYDVHNFRNWKDFSYEFDTSRCNRHPGYPELYQSVVTISEISSGEKVWKIGVYLNESEF